MTFGHTVRVSITIPLLLAAAACVPQDSAPKAANAAVPSAPAQQLAAPTPPLPSSAPAPSAPPPGSAAPASAAALAVPPARAVSKAPASRTITDLTAPRSGVGMAYRCGGGGMVTIQNLGGSLHVVGPDGWTEDFAASPANQSSRYQAVTHDAIVIDGREALVMKKGSTPRTCTR